MTAYEVRSYTGNAADTVLNANMASGALSFSVAPGTGAGYPDGSQGPFYVFIDYDTSGIEKVRCTGRINDTFTVPDIGSRGVDGTTAQAHTANAKVRHGLTATDAQEMNRAAANTVGKVTTKGDLLAGTGANALARLGVGADGTLLVADSTQTVGLRFTNTGVALDATSSVGGVTGTSLAADRAAWAAWTPAASNVTTSTTAGHFKQIGKTVHATGRIVLSGAPTSAIFVSLPANAALPFGANDFACGQAFFSHSGTKAHATVFLVSDGTNRVYFNVKLDSGFSDVGPTTPWTWASGDAVAFTVTYEAA